MIEYIDELEYSMNGFNCYLILLIVINLSGCFDMIFYYDSIYSFNVLFMFDVVNGCVLLMVIFYDLIVMFELVLSYYYIYGDGNEVMFIMDDLYFYIFIELGIYEVVLCIENVFGCWDIFYV